MDPRRALSRMTAKSASLERSTGGTPEVTASDVAAACAGLRTNEWLLVCAKWVEPDGVMDRLFYELYLDVIEMATREQWRVPRGREHLRRMAALAILEVLQPATCRRCAGTGYMLPEHLRHQKCPKCRGSGHIHMSGRQRARIVGMDHKGWQRHWAGRYERIYRRVAGMETSALAHIGKRLNRWQEQALDKTTPK